MGQVASAGEIQTHDAVVWLEEGSVHGEVGWGAGEGLHVDAPLSWVEAEELEGTALHGPRGGAGWVG